MNALTETELTGLRVMVIMRIVELWRLRHNDQFYRAELLEAVSILRKLRNRHK